MKKEKSARMYYCNFEGANLIMEGGLAYNSYIGYGTYICSDSFFYKTNIGRFCSIAHDVRVIAGRHPLEHIATSSMIYTELNKSDDFEEYRYADAVNDYCVTIGSDVWIGDGARILDGVSIGHGAVVGTSAIVTKDVPPYAIVGGNPARVLRYRFDETTIKALLKLQWWNKTPDWIDSHKELLSAKVTNDVIMAICEKR